MKRRSKHWFDWKELMGTEQVPAEAALVISEAMKKAIKKGDVKFNNRWQLIEYLCAEYYLN